MIDTENTPNQVPNNPDQRSAQLLEPNDYGEYLLHNRREIVQLLQQLLERGSQITIFFNEGTDLILTTLIAVNDDGLVFDYGSSPEINQRATTVAKLFCITQLDKVRVQFILRGLKLLTHKGLPAFSAALPDSVLRLQRRAYYRLTMPVTRRLTCQITLADGQCVEVEIVDLSGGGMALALLHDKVTLSPGMEFADCHIELPDTGSVTATVRVMSVFEIILRSGARVKRAGCSFVGLPGTMTNLIQRYILKIERERKARESGLE